MAVEFAAADQVGGIVREQTEVGIDAGAELPRQHSAVEGAEAKKNNAENFCFQG